MDKDRKDIDQQRRRFLVAVTSVIGGVGSIGAAIPFIASWLPSEKVQAAGAPTEADVSKLEPGALMTVAWRGKPIWILRRTEEMLKNLTTHEDKLRDPSSLVQQQPSYATNRYRSLKPEYLVLIGICTHLGCSPTYKPHYGELGADWLGGFFCPCHGSRFDLAGRVFSGVPAPINLEVPPYSFVSDTVVVIGVDTQSA